MLIYHITNEQLYCTEVLTGIGKSGVNHFKKSGINDCLEKHRKGVSELRSGGKVFVTGGTYVGSVYNGKFEDRASFKHYLGNTKDLKGD